MPAPGSSNALVLPSASPATDDGVPAGERVAEALRLFLDPTKYTAVAILHGLSSSAPRHFDLAKQRITRKRGVVWVTDPNFLAELTGPDAARMKAAFAPQAKKRMTFFAPHTRRTRPIWSLHWAKVNSATILEGFLKAGLDQ